MGRDIYLDKLAVNEKINNIEFKVSCSGFLDLRKLFSEKSPLILLKTK